MRSIAFALSCLLGFYLLLLIALFFLQRSMIYPAPEEIAPLPAGFSEVELHTSDGLTLRAAYRQGNEGRPVAVFFHGNADSWDGGNQATQQLSKDGYGVLLPEYRGYGGNPGQPDEEGLYADGRAALSFLEGEGIAADRMVLVGNSLGSGVAVQLAQEYSPAALVLISGYSSLPDVVAGHFAWLPARLMLLDSFASIDKIGALDLPILLLHGEEDEVIPFAHGQRLAEAAKAADFIDFPEMGHELAYSAEAQQAVLEWIAALHR